MTDFITELLSDFPSTMEHINSTLVHVWSLISSQNDLLRAWTQAVGTPITLWIIAISITQKLEQQKREDTRENRQEDILAEYLKQLTSLITKENLANSPHGTPVTRAAQALTVTVLLRLDAEHSK